MQLDEMRLFIPWLSVRQGSQQLVIGTISARLWFGDAHGDGQCADDPERVGGLRDVLGDVRS